MTREEFYIFVKEKTSNLLQLLEKKANEYAKSEEAFHNFIEGKNISIAQTEEGYAWDLRVKHLQSIKDLIKDCEKGILPNKNLLNEKFGDDLAYNLIIWAIIDEKINKNQDFLNEIRTFNQQ